MEITGEIITIIYTNKINSYTIAEMETDEEVVTVVGYLPFINIGDTLKLIGRFVEHKDYGRQFKVDTFEKVMPQTTAALEKYLANGNTYPDFRYTGSGTAGGHTHTVSGWTGGASSNHTHIVTAAGTVSSTFTGASATTSSVGSGSAINVQNPYTSVYMYKRTK